MKPKKSKVEEFLSSKTIRKEIKDNKNYIDNKLKNKPIDLRNRINFSFNFKAINFKYIKFLIFTKINQIRNISIEFVPIIMFVSFSCFIAYKMEDNHNGIKRKIQKNISVKEEKMHEENKIIKNIWENPKNKYYNKQLKEFKMKNHYKFEEDDEYNEFEKKYYSDKYDDNFII